MEDEDEVMAEDNDDGFSPEALKLGGKKVKTECSAEVKVPVLRVTHRHICKKMFFIACLVKLKINYGIFSVWGIRDVYPQSRIPDPNCLHPGSRILIKEFKYFNPQKSKKMVSKL
jgi:hypothetical protein